MRAVRLRKSLRRCALSCATLVAAAALIMPSANAVTFPDLFTVTVDLDAAAVDRRAAAIDQAMAILLGRVTGRTQAAQAPELAALMDRAPGLVTSYGQVDAQSVRIGFNGSVIQSALTDLGWPVWGADRPQVILWATVDFGGDRPATLLADELAQDGRRITGTATPRSVRFPRPPGDEADADATVGPGALNGQLGGGLGGDLAGVLEAEATEAEPDASQTQATSQAALDAGGDALIGNDGANPDAEDLTVLASEESDFLDVLREEFVRAADERGIPLQLPQLDEADLEFVSVEVVNAEFDPALNFAAERYAADFSLVAEITVTDLGLNVDWRLVDANGGNARLLTSVVRDGVDWVANQFAQRFSGSGGLQVVPISVSGISSRADYGRVMRYLSTLSIVETVDVTAFSGDQLQLSATVRGDGTVLDSVFELGGVLSPANRLPFSGGSLSSAGRYQLREQTQSSP